MLARKPDELEETVAALRAIGGDVTTFAGYAGEPEVIEARGRALRAEPRRGRHPRQQRGLEPDFGPTIDIGPRAVRKIVEVNIEGPLFLAQAAWQAWMRDHGGVILNISSLGGLRPSAGIGMYNTSKAALIHLTRTARARARAGRACERDRAGAGEDEVRRALYEHDEEGVARRFPLKRLGVPDDIAAAALFLASDASSWITGETVLIDGGAALGG